MTSPAPQQLMSVLATLMLNQRLQAKPPRRAMGNAVPGNIPGGFATVLRPPPANPGMQPAPIVPVSPRPPRQRIAPEDRMAELAQMQLGLGNRGNGNGWGIGNMRKMYPNASPISRPGIPRGFSVNPPRRTPRYPRIPPQRLM